MLRIETHVDPYGNKENTYNISKTLITNLTGRPFSCFDDYAFCIYEPSPLAGKPILVSGILRGLYRVAPVNDLLYEVMLAYKSKKYYSPVTDYEKEVVALLEETVKNENS